MASTAAAEAKPLMEIRYRSEIAAPTTTIQLWSTGAWTLQRFDADGTLASTTKGGLDNAELAEVRTALRAAPWQVTFSRIMCFAYSPSYTQYFVHGKLAPEDLGR